MPLFFAHCSKPKLPGQQFSSIAICQSNYGMGDHIEIAAVQDDTLFHIYRNSEGNWQRRREIVSNVSGTPSIIQSMLNSRGDFITTCPGKLNGIICSSRDNDKLDDLWISEHFGQSLGKFQSTAIISSTIAPNNIELVAITDRGEMIHMYRTPKGWNNPKTSIAQGFQGSPGFIQSRFGSKGHFEVTVASRTGGIEYWRRNNDTPDQPWNLVFKLEHEGLVFSSISMIQSNYDNNLEVLGSSGGKIYHFFGNDKTWALHSVTPSEDVGF